MAVDPTRPRGRIVYRSPHLRVWYEFNPRGIAKFAMNPRLRETLERVVNRAAYPHALSVSPHGGTGDYISSFITERTHVTILGLRRPSVRLVNDAPHAKIVEVGAKGTPAYRVFGKTLAYLDATAETRS
jgi:hypothetical protein